MSAWRGRHATGLLGRGVGTTAGAGGRAGNVPALLIDGRVAGVWHQRRSGRRIAVTVEPLDPLSAGHRSALEDEVRRIGHILEGTATPTLGKITVGAHA